MNFWKNLPKPFLGLSPMDGVSDAAFRYITAKYGKPDVITTEFISVDGVLHAAQTLFKDFWYSDIERPIAAQIFGIEPELFYLSAQIIAELGFDGVDINMGCPAKTVSRRGAGAGLIRNPGLAKEIIAATKQGVKDWKEKGIDQNINDKLLKQIELTKKEIGVKPTLGQRNLLPVSVKTRIGYEIAEVENWIPEILSMDVQNITVHGRTLKQMYQGDADWEALKLVGEIVVEHNKNNKEDKRTTYVANGDITGPEIAAERLNQTLADGLYVGRGTYGDPWIFDRIRQYLSKGELIEEVDIKTKAFVALEHAKLHYELNEPIAFVQMRKHLAWYIRGFPNAKDIRVALMKTNSPSEVKEILEHEGLYPNS